MSDWFLLWLCQQWENGDVTVLLALMAVAYFAGAASLGLMLCPVYYYAGRRSAFSAAIRKIHKRFYLTLK